MAGLKSVYTPGMRALCIANGIYGRYIPDMIGPATLLESPDESAAIEVIERERPELVTLVQCDTPSGIRWPSRFIRRVLSEARNQGALTYVDMVSALGGMPVDVTDWAIDIACTLYTDRW